MNVFGMHTDSYHLDIMENPPGAAEFRWDLFQTWVDNEQWNGGSLPRFAGRYFLGGLYQWGHGEGSSVQTSAATLERIAPIQAADPLRQAKDGLTGRVYGSEDATALCQRLATCILADEMSISDEVIYVFLDVDGGTPLSVDYWSNWAHEVYNFPIPGQPGPTQPFLPCICCDFSLPSPGSNAYSMDSQVADCLNNAQLQAPRLHARCYGFWAKAVDTSANPPMEPDWSRMPVFTQPITATADPQKPITQPVYVLIWRYLQPTFAGGNFISLDATQETTGFTHTFNRLLHIENWAPTNQNIVYMGVYKATLTANQITCLGGQNLHPPQQRNITATWRLGNPAQQLPFPGNVARPNAGRLAMVMRYYSSNNGSRWKDLTATELANLSQAGLPVAIFWELSGKMQEWSQANAGSTHALAAFTYAAVLNQPPYTPIYFCLDDDPLNPFPAFAPPLTAAASRQIVEQYFADVQQGYEQYLNLTNNITPYSIGVYGNDVCLRWCYEQGIVSHFCQANAWNQDDLWAHLNVLQVQGQQALAVCGFVAGPQGVDIIASWGDEGAWST